MSTPTERVYLQDARTGIIYEKRAEFDGYIWAQRLEDGTLDTFVIGYLVAYEPRPKLGETWINPADQLVLIVGKVPDVAEFYTVTFLPEDTATPPATLDVIKYRRRDLRPRLPRRARRRDEVITAEAAATPPPA